MSDRSIEIPGHELGLPMLQHVSRVESHCATRITWHAHTGFELIFLLRGASGYEFRGHGTVELHGGHFLVIPPNAVHRGLHDVRAPCILCGLAFNTTSRCAWRNTAFTRPDVGWLLETLQQASREVHPVDVSLRWVVRRVMEEVADFSAHPRQAEARTALRAWISALLVETARQMRVSPRAPKGVVSAAVAYLQQRLHEPIYMSELVRYLGFSRARVFEMFKAQTGHTPNEYLQRLRLKKAQELLRQGRLSVTEVALATGFGSAQHFSTVFRRYLGFPPASYRRDLQDAPMYRRRGK